MSNISIKNVSSAKICLAIPSIRFNRELMPGRIIPLTEDEYRELTFDPGCRNLIDGHFIKIFGVEEGQEVVETSQVYEVTDIAKMLDELDITSFAKFIPTASAAERDSVVKLAIDKGITHNGFVTLIKKYCDVDIINAINMKHQAEEK